jgi:hypothetical protein
VSPDPAASTEGWARVARASATYARVQADGVNVYYGDRDLRRIALANARGDLEHAILSSLAAGASEAWIVDAVLAGAPSLDALDAWTQLADARDAPERQAEFIRNLSRDFLRDTGREDDGEGRGAAA